MKLRKSVRGWIAVWADPYIPSRVLKTRRDILGAFPGTVLRSNAQAIQEEAAEMELMAPLRQRAATLIVKHSQLSKRKKGTNAVKGNKGRCGRYRRPARRIARQGG